MSPEMPSPSWSIAGSVLQGVTELEQGSADISRHLLAFVLILLDEDPAMN